MVATLAQAHFICFDCVGGGSKPEFRETAWHMASRASGLVQWHAPCECQVRDTRLGQCGCCCRLQWSQIRHHSGVQSSAGIDHEGPSTMCLELVFQLRASGESAARCLYECNAGLHEAPMLLESGPCTPAFGPASGSTTAASSSVCYSTTRLDRSSAWVPRYHGNRCWVVPQCQHLKLGWLLRRRLPSTAMLF